MSEKIILIVPFIFGAAIGSFLNVCIYRIPNCLSIVTPASRCPDCGRFIPFYYNIPVLSYFMLLGRCCFCKAPLSLRYPFVEALTGAFAVLLYIAFGPALELFAYFAFISALIVITFIDLDHQIIPDSISLPGILIGIALSFFLDKPGVVNSIIGAFIGGGILFAIAAGYQKITRTEGMGGGDIKLLAMIGAFLGWKGALFTLMAGSFAGAVIGGLLMLFAGRGGKYAIPFGPFLALGAVLYLFFGETLIAWYLSTITGPVE